MIKKITFLTVLAVCVPGVLLFAADTLVAQDENYFLQQEVGKARARIDEKDAALNRMAAERVAVKDELAAVQSERDALMSRVSALQNNLLERDRDQPRRLEQAAEPFRSRMDELIRESQILKLTVDRKSVRIDALSNELALLRKEMDRLNGEKTVLRDELRKVADRLEGQKTLAENQAAGERSLYQKKIDDLQSRLSAEHTLTGEKIKQAEKPLQDQIAALEPLKVIVKEKDSQLAALAKEKESLLVKLRTAELRNVECQVQLNELRKKLELLNGGPSRPAIH